MRQRTLLLGTALIATLALGAWVWRGHSAPSREYVTLSVDPGVVAPTVTASGTLNPVTRVQVGSYVSGVIQSLFCDFNTRVRAAQLCAMSDPRPYQSIVEQETANLATGDSQVHWHVSGSVLAPVLIPKERAPKGPVLPCA